MIAGRDGDITRVFRCVVFTQIVRQEIVQAAVSVLLKEAISSILRSNVPAFFRAEEFCISRQIEMDKEVNMEARRDSLRGIRPFGNQDAFRVLFIEQLPDLLPECTDAAAVRIVLMSDEAMSTRKPSAPKESQNSMMLISSCLVARQSG